LIILFFSVLLDYNKQKKTFIIKREPFTYLFVNYNN